MKTPFDTIDRLTRTETKVETLEKTFDRIESRLHVLERHMWTGIGILGVVQILAAWVLTRL